MVSAQNKMSSPDVRLGLLDRVDYGQTLLLHGCQMSLTFLKFPTQVGHWMLVTILILLAQNCSYPAVRRIGVDDELPVEVWSTQDRLVD